MISIEFSEFDLPNGLHVIMSRDSNAPVVAVDVWYHVGSKNEEPLRTGFAHLFEHMMFQGSANVGKAEHMKYIEQAGGVFNGSTTWDRTNYYETLPADRLELALWLESDRMMSLDISKRNLDNQREVVKEERRFRVDNRPYGTAWERVFSLAYNDHPYHWPVVGYIDHLNAASVGDVRSFFRRYYVPNNATVAIAGDFEPSVAGSLVRKYFGEIGSGRDIERRTATDCALGEGKREIVYDGVALPAVFLAFRVPSMHSSDSEALNLAAGILASGKSSRLYRSLVYDKKIAQSMVAFQIDMEDPGLFLVRAVVSPGCDPEEVEREIRKLIHQLSEKSPHDKEVEKVKNQVSSDWVKQMSKALGRADSLAHFHTFFGDAGLVNSYLDRFLTVSGREIRDVADNYLDTMESVVVYYLPREKGRSTGRPGDAAWSAAAISGIGYE